MIYIYSFSGWWKNWTTTLGGKGKLCGTSKTLLNSATSVIGAGTSSSCTGPDLKDNVKVSLLILPLYLLKTDQNFDRQKKRKLLPPRAWLWCPAALWRCGTRTLMLKVRIPLISNSLTIFCCYCFYQSHFKFSFSTEKGSLWYAEEEEKKGANAGNLRDAVDRLLLYSLKIPQIVPDYDLGWHQVRPEQVGDHCHRNSELDRGAGGRLRGHGGGHRDLSVHLQMIGNPRRKNNLTWTKDSLRFMFSQQ